MQHTFENVTKRLRMEVQSSAITLFKLWLTVNNAFRTNLQYDKQLTIYKNISDVFLSLKHITAAHAT